MATILTCPKCGGAINATPGQAKPCTCSTTPSADTIEVIGGGDKVCIACGKDVSHAKRMKDSKGNYWCYDCGKKDRNALKQSSSAPPKVLCPVCKKKVPTVTLLMDAGRLVCPSCYKRKRQTKTVEIHPESGSGIKIAVGVGIALAVAAASYFLFLA